MNYKEQNGFGIITNILLSTLFFISLNMNIYAETATVKSGETAKTQSVTTNETAKTEVSKEETTAQSDETSNKDIAADDEIPELEEGAVTSTKDPLERINRAI